MTGPLKTHLIVLPNIVDLSKVSLICRGFSYVKLLNDSLLYVLFKIWSAIGELEIAELYLGVKV